MTPRRIACLLALSLSTLTADQPVSSDKRKLAADLIRSLHTQPWPGAINISNPTHWMFRFTAPMQALLDLGPDASDSLIRALADEEIRDQAIILLGGVGDERAIPLIIEAMKSAASDPTLDRRRRTLLAGNLALTNITVADVIWHHGGGITIPRCPNDPAACWAAWLGTKRAHLSPQ